MKNVPIMYDSITGFKVVHSRQLLHFFATGRCQHGQLTSKGFCSFPCLFNKFYLCVPGTTARPPPSDAEIGERVIRTFNPVSRLPIFLSSHGQKNLSSTCQPHPFISFAESSHCISEKTRWTWTWISVRMVLVLVLVLNLIIIGFV